MSQWDVLEIFKKNPRKEFNVLEVEKILLVSNNTSEKLKTLTRFGYLDVRYGDVVRGKYPAYYRLRLEETKK